ncbi:12794_t:CDS:2, partial [Funneliformis mosseae]
RCLPLMGGYLTNSGVVDLKRLQYMVTELGKQEDDIFLRRYRNEQRRAPQPLPAPKRRKVKANKVIDKYKIIFNSLTNEYATYSLPHLPIGMPLLPVKGFDSHLRAKSNQEVVANRQELRIANINAAQLLKAELSSSDTTTSTANINITIDKNSNSSLQMDYGSSEVSVKQDIVASSDEALSTSLTTSKDEDEDHADSI